MLYQRGNYAVKQNEQTLLVLSAARLNGGSDAAVGRCAAGDHYQMVCGAPYQGIRQNRQYCDLSAVSLCQAGCFSNCGQIPGSIGNNEKVTALDGRSGSISYDMGLEPEVHQPHAKRPEHILTPACAADEYALIMLGHEQVKKGLDLLLRNAQESFFQLIADPRGKVCDWFHPVSLLIIEIS